MLGLIEIRRRRATFVLIVGVVLLVAYLAIMTGGLALGLRSEFSRAVENFGGKAIAYSTDSGLSIPQSELDPVTVDAVVDRAGATNSAPITHLAGEYTTADGAASPAAFFGYDPGSLAEPELVAGRSLTAGDAHAVVADTRFLQQSGLSIGDSLVVRNQLRERTFTIVGEIDEGTFGFLGAVYGLRQAFNELKYPVDTPGRDDRASLVVLGGGDLIGETSEGYRVVGIDEAVANIAGIDDTASTIAALQVLAYVIGAVVIGMFFYILTLQKTADIGLLKALGATDLFVARQTLIQVLTVAGLGLTVAVPAALATDGALRRFAPGQVPVAFTPQTYVTAGAAMMIVAAVSAAFAIRRSIRIDPVIAVAQQH